MKKMTNDFGNVRLCKNIGMKLSPCPYIHLIIIYLNIKFYYNQLNSFWVKESQTFM